MAEFSGHLSLRAVARSDGRTVLANQSFRAPYHLSKPYWDTETRTLIVQVVNPTAGILSGDRLESSIAVERGAALLATTPSASRVFRMREGIAECHQHFTVAADSWLEVMPEPLVPHRGCRYRQTTRIAFEPGAELFFADLLMAGRVAHGEAWAWTSLVLDLELRCGTDLILRERFDQGGDNLRRLAALAGSGDTACFGNVVLVMPTPDLAPNWRAALHDLHANGVWVGASPLRGGGAWSIKFIAPDGVQLRATLQAIRRILQPTLPHLGCDARKL